MCRTKSTSRYALPEKMWPLYLSMCNVRSASGSAEKYDTVYTPLAVVGNAMSKPPSNRRRISRGGRMNPYDPANAWTDPSGFLHLRIARRDGQWTCAEVRLTRSLGYGSYRILVREAAHLEPAVVFSIFTWDDLGADQNHREMGIEMTRWGDPASKNAQFVIQPYVVPANTVRFSAPQGTLTYWINWQPGKVVFKTVRGSTSKMSTDAVAEHVLTSGVPSPGNEKIHMNLYVYNNKSNPLRMGAEVIVEKFEFLP